MNLKGKLEHINISFDPQSSANIDVSPSLIERAEISNELRFWYEWYEPNYTS